MKSLTSLKSLAALSSLAFFSQLSAGCFLYFEDGDGPCDFGGEQVPDRAPEVGRINPVSGQCEFSGGGPFPCDDRCGPCPLDEPLEDDFRATWAFCEDQCTNLDEASCLATDACRGIYNQQLGYEACYGIDLTGPERGGDCTALDALDCSRHDDCFAIHESSPCDADIDTGAEAPSCELGAFVSCGNEDDPTDPGLCYGEVLCDEEPPECPPNSLPGIRNGCWSGFCIPVQECEKEASCNEIVVEMTCVARGDCAPSYRGIDCECDDAGCTCADHEFESCNPTPNL